MPDNFVNLPYDFYDNVSPKDVATIKSMASYHKRFTDLPQSQKEAFYKNLAYSLNHAGDPNVYQDDSPEFITTLMAQLSFFLQISDDLAYASLDTYATPCILEQGDPDEFLSAYKNITNNVVPSIMNSINEHSDFNKTFHDLQKILDQYSAEETGKFFLLAAELAAEFEQREHDILENSSKQSTEQAMSTFVPNRSYATLVWFSIINKGFELNQDTFRVNPEFIYSMGDGSMAETTEKYIRTPSIILHQ